MSGDKKRQEQEGIHPSWTWPQGVSTVPQGLKALLNCPRVSFSEHTQQNSACITTLQRNSLHAILTLLRQQLCKTPELSRMPQQPSGLECVPSFHFADEKTEGLRGQGSVSDHMTIQEGKDPLSRLPLQVHTPDINPAPSPTPMQDPDADLKLSPLLPRL